MPAFALSATQAHDSAALAGGLASPQPGSPSAAAPSSGASASAATDRAAGAATSADAQPQLSSINSARVLQSMQGSEMRVGLHSPDFGNISISTSINTLASHQSLAAQISFEHADLARALSEHLPAIEAKLSTDYGMQAKLEVRDQSASTAGDTGRNQSSAEQRRQGTGGSGGATTTSTAVVPAVSLTSAAAGGSGARLSIRA